MVIFLSSGRLGNQIFQYMFIRSIIKNNEIIIVSGFEDLKEVFEVYSVINIPKRSRYVKSFMLRIMTPTLNILSFFRLITRIQIKEEYIYGLRRESTEYYIRYGLLKFIKYIKFGYFQSEMFFDMNVTKSLRINDKYVKAANDFLKNVPRNSHLIFVHVRIGDYKNFKIFGKSTLLPMSYYKEQIKYFENNYKNNFFVFLCDEPEVIENEFSYLGNKIISKNNHPGTDFAIITKCKSGILSTSTFGWWGAYMIKNKGIIFAPKYWLGFNSNIEAPKGSFPSYAKEVIITPSVD